MVLFSLPLLSLICTIHKLSSWQFKFACKGLKFKNMYLKGLKNYLKHVSKFVSYFLWFNVFQVLVGLQHWFYLGHARPFHASSGHAASIALLCSLVSLFCRGAALEELRPQWLRTILAMWAPLKWYRSLTVPSALMEFGTGSYRVTCPSHSYTDKNITILTGK